MELASMLAGERFSDQPRAVCPIVAMVMRGYNDGIDDERRQELYPYAAAAVGTRDRRARRRRAEACLRFFGDGAATPRVLLHSRLRALGAAAFSYGRSADEDAHRRFLALLDELTEGCDDDLPPAARAAASGRTRA
jgi:hypothetical protein